VSEMAGVVAQALTGTRRYDGPMGKSDRAFVFALMSIALAVGVRRAIVFDGVLIVASLLLVATVINRGRAAASGGN